MGKLWLRNHSFFESFVTALGGIEGLFCEPTIVDSQFEWLEDLDGSVGKSFELDHFGLGVQYADQCVFFQFFLNFFGIRIIETEIEEMTLIVDGQIRAKSGKDYKGMSS